LDNGPWPGKLALAARPRGGGWLQDEIDSCADAVFSLLTDDEERELDLAKEQDAVEARGMDFLSYPVTDRDVPDSEANLGKAPQWLEAELAGGRNVAFAGRG
jgi:hypothetical protein